MSGRKKHNQFLRKISRFKKVALDSSCFIYEFAEHPQFVSFTHNIFRQIETGKMQAVTSVISATEIFVRAEEEKNQLLIRNYESLLLNFPNLSIFPVDWNLARTASKIRAEYHFRTPDALQLALAQNAQADAFITNDKKLKKFRKIEILVLGDFV